MRKTLMLALFLAAVAAGAQTVDIGAWPNGTIDLSSGKTAQWRTHAGDSPVWAQQGFDDSACNASLLALPPATPRAPDGTACASIYRPAIPPSRCS